MTSMPRNRHGTTARPPHEGTAASSAYKAVSAEMDRLLSEGADDLAALIANPSADRPQRFIVVRLVATSEAAQR